MDLTTVSKSARAESELLFRDSLMSLFPGLDVSPGTALNELLAIPGGAVAAYLASTMAQMSADLDLSTSSNTAVVGAMLDNFKLMPNQGVAGSGMVRFIFDDYRHVFVPAGVILKTGSTILKIPSSYMGVQQLSAMRATESGLYREMVQEGGYWVIYVPASTYGPQEDPISAGQYLQDDGRMPALVRAEAATSFFGGRAVETVDTLRAKWADTLTAPVCCSGANIRKLLGMASIPALDAQVAGAGRRESWRGATAFGVAPGGVVDVYSKTAAVADKSFWLVGARLADPARRVWSAVLNKSVMPGFYRVDSISHGMYTEGRSSIVSETWTADMSGMEAAKTGSDPAHFRFSCFQQCVVNFVFPNITGVDTADFQFELYGMPALAEHQALLDDPDTAMPGLDCLVRAPLPCVVSLSLHMHVNQGADPPDLEAVRTAAAAGVNATPMGRGWMSAMDVAAAAQKAAPGCSVMAPVVMDAVLLGQDGSELSMHSMDMLRVPLDVTAGTTPLTVCFMCSPTDVSISVN